METQARLSSVLSKFQNIGKATHDKELTKNKEVQVLFMVTKSCTLKAEWLGECWVDVQGEEKKFEEAFSFLSWGYTGVRWVVGGRKWGRAEAGWVTWAFVGRWWEAPPWLLTQNAKQCCHCLTSVAADACASCFSGNQKQKKTPPPSPVLHTYMPHHVSLNHFAWQDSTMDHNNTLQFRQNG